MGLTTVDLLFSFYGLGGCHGGPSFPGKCEPYQALPVPFVHHFCGPYYGLFVGRDRSGQIAKKYIKDAPDLVVEVSSPSTRRLELVRKRELYQRFGVPEYWYVDLEADRVEVYRLAGGSYPPPELLYPGDTLTSPHLPGLVILVDEALAIEANIH